MIKTKGLLTLLVMIFLLITACGTKEVGEEGIKLEEQTIPLFKLDKGEITRI